MDDFWVDSITSSDSYLLTITLATTSKNSLHFSIVPFPSPVDAQTSGHSSPIASPSLLEPESPPQASSSNHALSSTPLIVFISPKLQEYHTSCRSSVTSSPSCLTAHPLLLARAACSLPHNGQPGVHCNQGKFRTGRRGHQPSNPMARHRCRRT